MSIHDDGSNMLGPETYRAPADAGYYDWRFGKDGIPHSATCPNCGRKTDPDYINPEFRVRCRKRDLTMTYDGYVLVSKRFRDFCEANDWTQDTQSLALPADDRYYVFKPRRFLKFDAERRKTRFEDHCSHCREFFNVIGATPVFLCKTDEPISDGFFRTDLEFASGHEQSPLIIVGAGAAGSIKRERFQKVDLSPIES